jgi:hypothetical protein
MSEERGLIGTIVDNVGDTYQQILWNPGGAAPVAETPDFIISPPDISGPEIAAPEPMTDTQLQGVVMDVQEQNFAEAMAAPGPGDIAMPPLIDMQTGQDFTPISGPEIGPSADMGMDYTPADAPIVAEDYAPQGPAIEAPEISGPEIGADIGPSEGPDMG